MSLKRKELADRFKWFAAALRDSIKASKADVNWANSVETSYISELNRIGRELLDIDLDLFRVLDHRQPIADRANSWRFVRFFYADPINYRAGEFHSKELTRWQYQADGISCLLVSRNESSADAIAGVLNIWVYNMSELARRSVTNNDRMIEYAKQHPEESEQLTTAKQWAEVLGISDPATVRNLPYWKTRQKLKKAEIKDPRHAETNKLPSVHPGRITR